jgi:ATP phosphoribosyltransferase
VLRVAVPNKGVLSEPAAEMLSESGYRQRRSTKDLAVYDPDSDTEFFYLRPRDIAVYVAAGTLDVGITGRDMLLETTPADTDSPAVEVMPLGFGRSSFRFASPLDAGIESIAALAGKRIATAYPVVLERFLAESGIDAAVVKLDGAVETACRLGVADAVSTSSRPGRPCARPACTSSATRCSPARRSWCAGPVRRRTPPWRSCSAGSRASWSPGST